MAASLLLILVPASFILPETHDHVFAADSCMFLWVLAYRCLDHDEDLGSHCYFGVSQTGFLPVMLLLCAVSGFPEYFILSAMFCWPSSSPLG